MAAGFLGVTLVGMILITAGCQSAPDDEANLVDVAYDAADTLARAPALAERLPDIRLIYTSFGPVGDPGRTSRFGRIFADHVGSRLISRGVQVIEGGAEASGGSGGLSAGLRAAALRAGAGYALIGSYAPGSGTISMSLRVVEVAGGRIVATTDVQIPQGANTRSLLLPQDRAPRDGAAAEASFVVTQRHGGRQFGDITRHQVEADDHCRKTGRKARLVNSRFEGELQYATFTCIDIDRGDRPE